MGTVLDSWMFALVVAVVDEIPALNAQDCAAWL